MEEQSGLISFCFMMVILSVAIFVIVYWMDIDEEEKEAKRRQSFDRVEWSSYQVNKNDEPEKLV